VTFRTGSPFLVEEVHADLEEELEEEEEP